MWTDRCPLTNNIPKQTNRGRKAMVEKARSTISKIFTLSLRQLGLNRELSAMAVFLVLVLSTLDNVWHFDNDRF